MNKSWPEKTGIIAILARGNFKNPGEISVET